ncbi:hypothetical protein ES707_12013 [subsurface metagenome]
MLIAFMLDYHRPANLAFTLFFNSNCLAFDDVYKGNSAGHFRQNRRPVRVPAEQYGIGLDLLAVFDENTGTIWHSEPVQFPVLFIK